MSPSTQRRPLLSILTPSIPERIVSRHFVCTCDGTAFGGVFQCTETCMSRRPPQNFIEALAEKIGDRPVEHLVLTDNRRRPVGAKRQALLEMARGEYVAFLDDDDAISWDYLAELLPRCESGPDVVTFEQDATVDGVTGRIIFDAAARFDEPWKPNGTARRRPWHVCAWRRELALRGVFTEINYGEDAAWVDQVAPLARNTLHVPKVLHYYRHSAATTAAPPPAG